MSDQTDESDVRIIETGTNPERFARGWHCLGLEREFKDGKPHRIDAFGTALVVFADSTGNLNVLDAYCRHMGGNLADGTIKGDAIACPFHDWRWGGDGRCAEVPYARRNPRLARTKSWPTLQRNGLLFVWNDPQGSKPTDAVTIPELSAYGSDEWTDWSWNTTLVTGSHCREMVDNVVDMAHFFYVHFAMPTYFKNVFEGHVATQYMNGHGRPDVHLGTAYDNADGELESWASYYGPSFMINGQTLRVDGFGTEGLLINCHYPVTSDSFLLQYGAIVKKNPALSDAEADQVAGKFIDSLERAFEQDVAIWKNKTRIDNPLLCEEDGPVYQLRRWYEQFYVDVEDIAPDMVRRFEFEMDLARPVQTWEAEVQANIAAGREIMLTT